MGLLRKIIHIPATASPNVQYALAQEARGEEPTGKGPDGSDFWPGVLSWDQYVKRLQLWDEVMQCVGLRGEFWEGASTLMYPPEWLNESARVARRLFLKERLQGIHSKAHQGGNDPFVRTATGMGCDPGEGGDKDRMGTAWTIIDEYGILEQVEERTTDTSAIARISKALIRKYTLDPRHCAFDRGGGGKQIADQMRSEGYEVRTIGFGESVIPDPKLGRKRVGERIDEKEEKYSYPSMRCKMYHTLRLRLDPRLCALEGRPVFAIPEEYHKLRQELAPIPLQYDKDGRVVLPPKHKERTKGGRGFGSAAHERSLCEIIGHSPDLADSLVLALAASGEDDYPRPRAGAMRSKEEIAAEREARYSNLGGGRGAGGIDDNPYGESEE